MGGPQFLSQSVLPRSPRGTHGQHFSVLIPEPKKKASNGAEAQMSTSALAPPGPGPLLEGGVTEQIIFAPSQYIVTISLFKSLALLVLNFNFIFFLAHCIGSLFHSSPF